jgi:exopolysaccharide biosynthesis polyprenyl glycosylphosphotransferase
MATVFRPRTLILFAGDILFFTLALFITLFVRALELPSRELFSDHTAPFSILFAVWVVVFFIAGLYESRSIILARRALSSTLLTAQTVNVCLAALFFFFVPLFDVSPKTVLFIYLFVSFLLILLWRAYLFPYLGLQKPEAALVVGEGSEVDELVRALRHAPFAPARIAAVIQPSSHTLAEDVQRAAEEHRPHFIIADLQDTRVSAVFSGIYNYLSSGVRFFDVPALYEEVFGRIPLSVLNEQWFAQNTSRYAHIFYDHLKRLMDIAGGITIGAVSLLLYPFIMLAIKLDDGGPAIIAMPRVGEGGRVFDFYKFRSMSGNDHGKYGADGASRLTVTRVGRFLRTTRLDEMPQLWNVVRGDLSLIGPRPEFPHLVKEYEHHIPYYGVRHLIKPGLSGWAQLYYHQDPHHAADVEATKAKLAYDLYYLKHRSLMLDIVVALKTVRRLLIKSNA